MVDEIIWSEVARGIADAGEPLLRDEPDPGYSIVYPLLISPVYALFDGLPDAYAGVKTLNALVMSLAAVPAFFLARRVVRDGLALLAALMAVAMPVHGVHRDRHDGERLLPAVPRSWRSCSSLVLERPTPLPVVVLFSLVGLAFATRVQAVALVPAILLAPVVLAAVRAAERHGDAVGVPLALRDRRRRGALAVLAVQLATGREDLLGAYAPVGERSYDARARRFGTCGGTSPSSSLYVLVIPLAATIVLVARARSLDARAAGVPRRDGLA